ncbi:MAG: hypothetical protein CL681_22395 [Blastopirellula sp.]|mgnify:FL=1|nr:hypothetical protein [Blastopirellula sp.]
MKSEFFEINHKRLSRLVRTACADAEILWDQVNDEVPAFHFITKNRECVHAIPLYNTDDTKLSDYLDFFSGGINQTAIIPIMSTFNKVETTDFFAVERPNLLEVEISKNMDKQWAKLHKSKRRNIRKLEPVLEFGMVKDNDKLKEVFVDSYFKVQLTRSTIIAHFFDKESLLETINLDCSRLFFARDIREPSSMLMHLNFLVDETCFFVFSTNTSEGAKEYSASLHWYVIKQLARDQTYKLYSLGGGLRKDDGIEKFKIQLGATPKARRYLIYPKQKYKEGFFFPKSHAFLSSVYVG